MDTICLQWSAPLFVVLISIAYYCDILMTAICQENRAADVASLAVFTRFFVKLFTLFCLFCIFRFVLLVMNSENASDALANKLPAIRKCCFLVVLTGLTCATVVLVRDKEHLTMTAVLLTLSISLFIVSTLMFIVASLMLPSAVAVEDPDLMSQYIWLAIAYLSVQLVLAVAIPVLLVVDGKYPVTIVLIWMVVVLLICLCWTHFISVVNSYRISML